PLVFGADVPDWLRGALGVLCRRDLGIHFNALMQALIRVEERVGFEDDPPRNRLAKLRPTEVSAWIGSGRGMRSKNPYDAGVKSAAAYRKKWDLWWSSLQPEWRKQQRGRWVAMDYDDGLDWGELASHGPNGGLSIVAAVYFWGVACVDKAETTAADKEKWEMAVHDVTWAFEGV
ncbi:hypothetical protein C8R46DRAFT_928270, partial [Mycena filopes]